MDHSGTDAEKIQAQQLAEAERRVVMQYAGRRDLSEDRVHQTFERVAGRFARARVRGFLPILIERAVRRELAATPAEPATGQPGPADDGSETTTVEPEPDAKPVRTTEAEPSTDGATTASGEASQPTNNGHVGFGERIEKMLRVAEAEAAEVRAEARREAAEMLERARATAQAREREHNESFRAGQAELDERAERLDRDLQAHQKAMTDELAAARAEAQNLRAGAAAEAAAVLDKARGQARTVVRLAENAVQQHHEWLHGEIERLVGGRDGVRVELTRMREQLSDLSTNNQEAHHEQPSAAPTSTPTTPWADDTSSA